MSSERRRELLAASGSSFGNFGGYMWAPGPLVYENGAYRIQEYWNEVNSYNSKYGATNGSTYFTFVDIGKRFSSQGSNFSTSSGKIDNANPMSFDIYNDWGVPTQRAYKLLIGIDTDSGNINISRNGSTVNGNANKHFSFITTTITYAGGSNMKGHLFFPDNREITGKTLSGYDNYTNTSGVTADELNEYIEQGCIFIPFSGNRQSRWNYRGSRGFYWTATQSDSSSAYVVHFSGTYSSTGDSYNKSSSYLPVYLCREIPKPPKPLPPFKSFGGLYFTPGPLIYDGTDFQVQPYWDSACSYGSISGLNTGSTYFNIVDIGRRFDSRGSSYNGYSDINNANPLSWQGKSWRVPTRDEIKKLAGAGPLAISRNGSTVNGNANAHYCYIKTTMSYADADNIQGYLIFPDNETITGVTLRDFDKYSYYYNTGITEAALDNYISQGCLFLPYCGGIAGSDWSDLNTDGSMTTASCPPGNPGSMYKSSLHWRNYNGDQGNGLEIWENSGGAAGIDPYWLCTDAS